ncbi:MAG: peptidoglycan-binding protein LysM [Flavobacteriia bacterium]|nr:peptidoglycan-binding protein LysM [Flavobacteriia bacterium]OIP47302.1 MAG: peptidoglycan-binding protein LysM [Flavobacteriaceae bacterium CG2_30_31_66]PIV96117.1 MAG: peptidoglycan-binding protein LysM [Flavobacteriaceae bacterium CG17_big_fil_post_rev_8_21_14_2_50_31_13]PIX13043.1 MAG: peptidoglycan-binding protein LysM [Flavobacteriaceae bacterium CG_4_8_14_3_um_filter_31_8]PIY14334.1 MAG: peptidoglycan-binding protein LysM [Flavobacteriaceae bacterium CG_4_10_14_3_um_filter_31_253]PIZ
MIKKFFLYSSLLFLFVGATFTNNEVDEKNKTFELEVSKLNIPYLQKNFVGFKEAVAYKESRGNYTIVNSLGYLGKYQFGRNTLGRFKIYNTRDFLKNPELQEQAFISLCEINKWILRKEIKRYEGKTINGIEITESGIIAAAHLAGAGNVKKFLRSNGTDCFSDAFGSSLKTYLKKFSGYDISSIKPNKYSKN